MKSILSEREFVDANGFAWCAQITDDGMVSLALVVWPDESLGATKDAEEHPFYGDEDRALVFPLKALVGALKPHGGGSQ